MITDKQSDSILALMIAYDISADMAKELYHGMITMHDIAIFKMRRKYVGNSLNFYGNKKHH